MSPMGSQDGLREDVLPPEPRERCAGRKSRRLPTIATVDISGIDSHYLDSLMEVVDTNSRSMSPWEYR